MPPKSEKQHKLECFALAKKNNFSSHHRNNFLPHERNEVKRFCFQSKQAPSMKMVISHHFSFRWKTFMFRIIIWWNNFALTSFLLSSSLFRETQDDGSKKTDTFPALKHKNSFSVFAWSEAASNDSEHMRALFKQWYLRKKHAEKWNKCWIKLCSLIMRNEFVMRCLKHRWDFCNIFFLFPSVSKRSDVKREAPALKFDPLQMPLK